MRNSNVKIFTAVTYLLLLILILASVTFLIVKRIQLAKQAEAYSNQVVQLINNSYLENGSFTQVNFTSDVEQLMQDFSELIKVVTIVDDQEVMLNRFRLDSIDPSRDPNPNWQNNLSYNYNPLLYEQQSYSLDLAGQNNTYVEILFQHLPIQLIKDVLQFDTVVILALLILSFLAFLIVPKRDPSETAWALQSVAEEDDLYQEASPDGENLAQSPESWSSQDLLDSNWEQQGDEDSVLTNIADDEDDEFGKVLSASNFTNINPKLAEREIEGDSTANNNSDDPWGSPDETENDSALPSDSTLGKEENFSDIDVFTSLKADDSTELEDGETIDLSFNDAITSEEAEEPENDNLLDDDLDLNEEDVDIAKPLDAITVRAPETGQEQIDEQGEESLPLEMLEEQIKPEIIDNNLDELDAMLSDAIQELNKTEPTNNAEDTQLDDDFTTTLNEESADTDAGADAEEDGLDSEELIDDLDEGLGDDELEPIDDELSAEFFSQLATPQWDMETLTEDQESEKSSESEVQEAVEESENQAEETNIGEAAVEEEQNPLDSEYNTKLLGWLNNFLEEQKIADEGADTPDLSVALIESSEEDIEIVQASLEQDLALHASFLPSEDIGRLAVVLPSTNMQQGIEQLQSAVSRLPNSYLQNLKMGITGISSARREMAPQTVITEVQYALANCDQDNNISIFDVNDQVFNQQHNQD